MILPLFLAGCLGNVRTEYIPVIPAVDETLRTPVVLPEREVNGLQSVGIILADAIEGLDLANGRIAAIDCILDAAEAGAQPNCAQPQ